ncbi:salicylate hydroxylase [Talaromyces pinophilus]|uniref:Salicylate hydroxylase n=1 Tax=Talaromyces pinophilus TaxID=128442 RepID=A0A6V8HES0_TALPI|nr:salicylate hydroxylase [Talaromyces pinophilus]
MPLEVIIVGAGIAGLSAAVSLCEAGHRVRIFEKSKFAAEIGAAVVLSPNAVRVLSTFGFSCDRAQARQLQLWETVDGRTLNPLGKVDHREAEQKYGAPLYAIHRVDLHNELLRLIGEETNKPATIHLRSKVVDADPEKGFIELEDGTKHYADLIVAADGLRSVLRKTVFRGEDVNAKPTGLSAFRFLIPTPELEGYASLATLRQWKQPGVTIIADTTDTVNERHMVWYDCRRIAPDITYWPLSIHDPLPRWSYGKVVLIGDAAHPGSNQAIEDGGALGYLLREVDNHADISDRLALFEQVRRNRASRVQILSKARVGQEKSVQEELQKYADPPGSVVPTTHAERTMHDFGFDLIGKCNEALAQPVTSA